MNAIDLLGGGGPLAAVAAGLIGSAGSALIIRRRARHRAAVRSTGADATLPTSPYELAGWIIGRDASTLRLVVLVALVLIALPTPIGRWLTAQLTTARSGPVRRGRR